MKTTDYIKTFALVALVLFFTVQRGNSVLLAFLLPFFLMAVIYTSVRMFKRAAERKKRGIRLAIWSLTLALACTVQTYWSITTRNDAESALKKVLAYKERAGTYPASLKEVGLDDTDLKNTREIRYWVKEGKPALVYPVPFMPLTMHEYDFEARKWRENAY